MRASDFDAQERIYNLKSEIEAIAVSVRKMRERSASGDVADAKERLAAARKQLQQLSRPPPTALGLSPPTEF